MEGAPHQHRVRLLAVQHPLRDVPVVDPPDEADDQPGLGGFDGEAERRLVRGPDFELVRRVVPAGGDIEEVDAVSSEDGSETDGVF